MAKILVSVRHADGQAAIVRTWRGLCLAGYAEQPSALIDDDEPAVEGLDGDRTAQGGRLPPGATGAEVVDDAGGRHTAAAANGAWVVVLDQPATGEANPVRFVDAAGATVPAPLPAGPRTAIADAPEPCPACGASGWDQIVPDDRSGGMGRIGRGRWRPDPLVACRTCGHAEATGTFYSPLPAGEAPPWPDEEGLPEGEPPLPPVDPGGPDSEALAHARFPVYAVPGRPAEVRGWGAGQDGIHSITVAHAGRPYVRVTTDRGPYMLAGEGWLARRALGDLDDELGSWPDRSQPAVAIWMNARERQRRRRSATAELSEGDLMLEGEPARFTIATGEPGWAAVRRHGNLLITVSARDCAPTEIELDPLVY